MPKRQRRDDAAQRGQDVRLRRREAAELEGEAQHPRTLGHVGEEKGTLEAGWAGGPWRTDPAAIDGLPSCR